MQCTHFAVSQNLLCALNWMTTRIRGIYQVWNMCVERTRDGGRRRSKLMRMRPKVFLLLFICCFLLFLFFWYVCELQPTLPHLCSCKLFQTSFLVFPSQVLFFILYFLLFPNSPSETLKLSYPITSFPASITLEKKTSQDEIK